MLCWHWFGAVKWEGLLLTCFNVAGGRDVVYDDGPGWKYPESVSENERMTLNAQIDSVRVDL